MSRKPDMEREVWAEDKLVETFLKEEDPQEMRRAILVAVLIHVVLLLVTFPTWTSNWERENNEEVVYLTSYVPPPQTEVKPKVQQVEKVKKIPLPDPTPDEPEPIREPDPEPEPPLPPNAKILFGMPKGPPAPQALRVGAGGIGQLKVIKRVQPDYPILAKKAEVQGLVVLDILVTEEGRVGDVKVLKELPMGLTEAAVTAVKKWELEPATQFGRKVPAWMTVKVTFKLD